MLCGEPYLSVVKWKELVENNDGISNNLEQMETVIYKDDPRKQMARLCFEICYLVHQF